MATNEFLSYFRRNILVGVYHQGHSPGMGAKGLLDGLKKYVKSHRGKGTMADQLSAYLIYSSNLIDGGHIGFFQVNVYRR